MNAKRIWIFGCLFLGTAVLLGAFAAHGLKDKISAYHLDVFQKGVYYQFTHGFALLILSLVFEKLNKKMIKISAVFFILGIILFSGSLYVLGGLQLQKGDGLLNIIGPITPIGGVCFIAGWITTIYVWKRKSE